MDKILNFGILLLLSFIFFKFFGFFGILIAILSFGLIHFVIIQLTSKVNNEEFQEIDLYEINKIDIILYKIFGARFLNFRKKHENIFDNYYFHFRHFINVNLKVYFFIIFFSVAILVSYFSIDSKIAIDRINNPVKNQEKPPENIKNTQNNQTKKNNSVSEDNIKTSNNYYIPDSDEAFYFRQHIIEVFKKRYGDKWKDYLRNAIQYYKNNRIVNDYTNAFVKEDGTIEITDE